jgi:hypothetical protein
MCRGEGVAGRDPATVQINGASSGDDQPEPGAAIDAAGPADSPNGGPLIWVVSLRGALFDRQAFARNLKRAVVGAFAEFCRQAPVETPCALAMIQGQRGAYLGYAVATEEGRQRVAAGYAAKGYSYRGQEWEQFDNQERLAEWLRSANPDDGWRYGVFADTPRGESPARASESRHPFLVAPISKLLSKGTWTPE